MPGKRSLPQGARRAPRFRAAALLRESPPATRAHALRPLDLTSLPFLLLRPAPHATLRGVLRAASVRARHRVAAEARDQGQVQVELLHEPARLISYPLPWNGTDGGVINGGVSQKNAETCKFGRICAKLAGFARNLRDICANLRKIANLFLQNLRKFARNLRPRLLRYRLFQSDLQAAPPGAARRAVWQAGPGERS